MPQTFPHIDVRVTSLGELFTIAGTFEMPWFQRSYAWGEDHIDRLVNDVDAAACDEVRGRYFLGHVCLAGRHNGAIHIIDGQQRIMTLTMLYALLRDLAPEGADTQALDDLIWSAEGGGRSKPRVIAQDCVRDFLQAAVIEPGATAKPIDPYRAGLTASEQRFLANRDRMAGFVAPMRGDPARWTRFLKFLIDRCYVIVETIESEDEAWDMLAKEEERRAGHHPSELAKASMIGVMPRAEQADAGRIWDEVHTRLGANNVERLLGHLHTMLAKRTSTRPLITELSDGYALNRNGPAFMRETFALHAGSLQAILARRVGSGEMRTAISRRLDLLDLVDFDHWMAPLLHWLSLNSSDESETLSFVEALDRLALMLRIAGVDPTTRERSFSVLTHEIKAGTRVADLTKLGIEPALSSACEKNLRSRTLQYKRYAPYVLRRLNWLLGDRELPGNDVTIEHILPRNPPSRSVWRETFTGEQMIDDHANRLGNLVLLSFEDNQKAGNLSWSDKRPILAASRYHLAREAAEAERWTRETINARTDRLARLLLES